MKIIATIGPNENLEKYIKTIFQYTNYVRTNASHNNIKWHENISKIIKKNNSNAFYLLDIPGIKPRTTNTQDLVIRRNDLVIFIYKNKKLQKDKNKIINISKPLPKINKSIKFFSLDDGKHQFKLVFAGKNKIIGKSLNTFNLRPAKGLNIPLSIYDEKLQNKSYLDFLIKCKKINFNAIGLSYIQSDKIISKIRNKFKNKLIVSKIENFEGLKNSNEIIKASDFVMIDRGDLAAEIGNKNLFTAINNIATVSKKYNKPLIMATENLNNMITNLQPTKSEIISLEYSKLVGTEFIMLSEETATSPYWLNTIKWLKLFLSKKLN